MPIYLIIAIAGSLVGIEILPFFLSLIIRLFRRERKEEIRKAREIAEGARSSCLILRGELDETNKRVDELEKNEMSISNSLVYIMRYLRLNAEVSTSIKTTLKILIAIVSLFSGVSSIMRFVQSFLL